MGVTRLIEQQTHESVLDQITRLHSSPIFFSVTRRGSRNHDDSLLESGLVDSTGVLEIVDFLETDMGITVADDETVPANLDSIDNLTQFVMRKRAGATVG